MSPLIEIRVLVINGWLGTQVHSLDTQVQSLDTQVKTLSNLYPVSVNTLPNITQSTKSLQTLSNMRAMAMRRRGQ